MSGLFRRWWFGVFGVAVAGVGCFSPGKVAIADQPNVLFIAVDDLNDWIGCMKGHPQASTPNIDRLASRGVLFSDAHCAAPACNPSRAAVFSGKMPNLTGVWSNESPRLTKLQPDVERLPTSFAKAGYRTLGTGKLSGDKPAFQDFFDVDQRWSPLSGDAVAYNADELHSKGTENPGHRVRDPAGNQLLLPLNRMPSDRKPDDDAGESFDWGAFDVPDSEFGDTQITDWAIKQLSQLGQQSGDQAKPFFLGVGYYRPHIPLWAPKRFFDRFVDSPAHLPPIKNDDLVDLSATAQQWALQPITAGSHATVVRHQQWQAAVAAYLACVSYVDHEIGRLLDALDASTAKNDTVIVLWSDHGWHLGEKEHWGKWTGWNRATRVPLVIVPAKSQADQYAAAGSICDQSVSLVDLYPTLTELCSVTPPSGLQGQSLVPLLRDPNRKTDRQVLTMFDPGNLSIKANHWRYIRYADGSEELYDHRSDPNEWNNLAGLKRHETLLDDFRERVRQKTDPGTKTTRVQDLRSPETVDGVPEPGKRVRQFHHDYVGTGVYHLLYLPRDWKRGAKYPVIVEYAGNRYKTSPGTVEGSNLGYGVSGGNGVIWVCMPYVNRQTMQNQETWWGDVDATVAYCRETVASVCTEYGGDSDNVFLAGFSRGAIACNFIGLADDQIASLWRGFICHSHYDGVRSWPYPASDRVSAAMRLKRLGNRPQFISHETSVDATRDYLSVACPEGRFTYQPLVDWDHTDTWVLHDIPERQTLRAWFAASQAVHPD